MDWLTSHRPVKSIEFYQRKLLSFLFSAEGKDDLRYLGIPFAQLGFYSPMHFISCISSEMCEPFKNDKLFLASTGDIRRGDKVFLLEEGTEGVIRSAVFKGKRVGKDNEPEMILEGHRKTYSVDEVVPYKAYLRQHLGTSLIPESDYEFTNCVVEWEEPTFDPGTEIYYGKTWCTILSHEVNAKGRSAVTIKMDRTKAKKEKILKILLDDLMAEAVPMRVPKRIRPQSVMSASSTDDLIMKVMAQETFPETPTETPVKIEEQLPPPQVAASASQEELLMNGQNEIHYDKITPSLGNPPQEEVEDSRSNPNSSKPECLYATVNKAKTKDTTRKSEDTNMVNGDTIPKPILRKKSKKSKETVRPKTEYLQQSEQSPSDEATIYQDPEPMKFKSCNNLNVSMDDDDLEPFEMMNYTNSLRSSARKLMQRQLAQDAQHRSLKLQPTRARPHVEEIFKWGGGQIPDYNHGRTTILDTKYTILANSANNSTNNLSLSDRHGKNTDEPNCSMKSHSQKELYYDHSQNEMKPDYSLKSSSLSNKDLRPNQNEVKPDYSYKSSSLSNKDIRPSTNKFELDYSYKSSPLSNKDLRPNYNNKAESDNSFKSSLSQKELRQSQNPLEYNFLPLSSSDLVKQQLAVVNRVLKTEKTNDKVSSKQYNSEMGCASSDSSSHEIDSGRGSIPLINDVSSKIHFYSSLNETGRRDMYEDVSPTRSPMSSDSAGNITPANQGSLNKRYTKNRSLSKHSMQKHISANEENVEEEYNLPHPFNPANLHPVAGYGKGIQGCINSSYADATLFALFSCSNIFDRDLLFSHPGQIERGIKKDVRRILREKIVTPLRLDAYCKSKNVTHLREAMLPLSSKMHSPLMDAEEFLYLLFDSALNTESFAEFSNGTKDFMHQIVARPKDRSKSQTLQFMLETSLGTTGMKFKNVPHPALLLCMPRCKGRLVYYEAIIPSLHINITKLLQKGPKQCVCEMAATLECVLCHQKNGDMALDFCEICKGIADQIHFRLDHSPALAAKQQEDEILHLHSIICTRGNRYVAFVKTSKHRFAPWLFFDPMAGEQPEVTLLEDFGRWLDSLERQPGSYREFAKLHPLLKRIMTDSCIYIYSKALVVDAPPYTESLVI